MDITLLKKIAASLGYTYKGNLGAVKLEQALREYCESNNLSFDEIVQENTEMAEELKEEKIITFADIEPKHDEKTPHEIQREALKLIHCIVTCNNKNKTAYSGEIFSASNASIPEVKKYVQFGTPYHVPQIIYNVIKSKKMTVFQKVRGNNGGMVTVSREVPEYSIQELEPLTPEELESIKKKQLAEGYTGGDN